MKILIPLILALSMSFAWAESPATTALPPIAASDVTWTTLGTNENDSMPIGNGDLAANVWTEQNGDIVILLAKADAWDDTQKPVKLGRVRLQLSPNPFLTGSSAFIQKLELENGSIAVTSGSNSMRIWIDWHLNLLQVVGHTDQPCSMRAVLESWRPTQPYTDMAPAPDALAMSGSHAPRSTPDMIVPPGDDRVTWLHFNANSTYPYVLAQEHLESSISKYPDPLFHRAFGATMLGWEMAGSAGSNLHSIKPARDFHLQVVALTERNVESPKRWRDDLDSHVNRPRLTTAEDALQGNQAWWNGFWNRSWIKVSGTDSAAQVTQGYAMQRYMMSCQSRGELPVKFNGGIFTVGHDLATKLPKQTDLDHDPDYRKWGEWYWNQNNRLLYWPLIATGDRDLLQPWFNMYLNALPLAMDRTQTYYHHAGAHFAETMNFWGLARLGDFGKDNPTDEIQSHWQRYHIQGSLEVIAQMLDYYDAQPDAVFARKSLVPFADAIVTFYDKHYPRDPDGKIRMEPAQSLETYQLEAINPTPDVAGLHSVIPRLLALPHNVTTQEERAAWTKTLADLPAIPIGKTAKGKVPPLGVGDPDGKPEILPAEKYGKTGNSENPELYVTFPYRLYGVGKPGLQLARDTYAARRSHADTCWGQDGTEAAVMGLASEAQKAVVAEFADYGDQRFQWFWKPGHDWIPDLDNGGSGMITLQQMLMQCDGKRIQLLPAWPHEWTADFKLHAPYNTTVQAHVENGTISKLIVTPTSRAKDVEVLAAQ